MRGHRSLSGVPQRLTSIRVNPIECNKDSLVRSHDPKRSRGFVPGQEDTGLRNSNLFKYIPSHGKDEAVLGGSSKTTNLIILCDLMRYNPATQSYITVLGRSGYQYRVNAANTSIK